MGKSFQTYVIGDIKYQKVEVISGMNGVATARHGLILWENEATGSRKLPKYLPGLQDIILCPKLLDKVPKSEKSPNPVNYVYSDIYIYIYGTGGMGAALFYKGVIAG